MEMLGGDAGWGFGQGQCTALEGEVWQEMDGDVGQGMLDGDGGMEPWSRKRQGEVWVCWMEVLDGEWGWTRSVETQGMLDGEMRPGGAEWEGSDGDTGWGHQVGTWQRGTAPGNGWMEMLGEEASSFFPPFTIFFHLFSRKQPKEVIFSSPFSNTSKWVQFHGYWDICTTPKAAIDSTNSLQMKTHFLPQKHPPQRGMGANWHRPGAKTTLCGWFAVP